MSQPTVVRFVKALGYDSFKEFRYSLVREISELESRRMKDYSLQNYSINPGDDLKYVPAKVIASTVGILENMLKSISQDEFKRQ